MFIFLGLKEPCACLVVLREGFEKTRKQQISVRYWGNWRTCFKFQWLHQKINEENINYHQEQD